MCYVLCMRWSSSSGPGNIDQGHLNGFFAKPSQMSHSWAQARFVIPYLGDYLFKQLHCFITRSSVCLSNSTLSFWLNKSIINSLWVCVISTITHLFLDRLEQGPTNYIPYAKSDLMPAFANKITVGYTHCPFTCILWLFAWKDRNGSYNTDCTICKTENT